MPPPTPGTGRKPRAAGEPLLEVDEIQGNVLAGFNKDYQRLIGLRVRDATLARRWVRRIAGAISTTAEVLLFNNLFRMQRARLGADPPGLVATWANVAFSHPGLAKLMSPEDADAVPDAPFRLGLPARAGALNDPAPAAGGDPTADWVGGGTGRVPDVLLIVAGDDPGRLDKLADRLRPGPGDGADAPEVVWEEVGLTRPDLPGHEHFGFKDGVSQPGVRGLVSRRPDVYLTRRLLAPAAPDEVAFARPGQPLVWPGQFVFPGVCGPAVAFPAAMADPGGLVCPHAAHVRKVNPRDQDTDLGTQFDTLTRRILRRGIPYGAPLLDRSADDGADRGLHFLCYQASIEEQFEKLQQDWANNDRAPLGGTRGHDVVIGQTPSQVREFELLTPDGATSRTLTAPRQWVVTTGRGYFFAPSLGTLRDVLGRVTAVA